MRTDRRRSSAESVGKRNLDRLAQTPGRWPVADAKGLFLKVKAPGRASWTYRYRLDGRETETSLGAYSEMTLDQATQVHAEKYALVKKKTDPLAERRASESAPAGALADSTPTFAGMAAAHIAAKGKWSNERHRGQWLETVNKHCAKIALTPVDKVNRAAVLEALRPLPPATAQRACGRIGKVLTYAYTLLGIEDEKPNPAIWKDKLALLMPDVPAAVHLKAMPYKEVPAFTTRLKARPGVVARALMFTILTAARSNEVLGMRWGEVDLANAVWTVPAHRMKKRKEHVVPLSDAATAVLKTQHTALSGAPDPGACVFPGMRPGKPLTQTAMMMALRAMKAGCTVHGFRSSFRDFAGDETNFPREVCEAALSHKVGDEVEQAYRRGDALAKRRELMQAWADYCAGERPAKVVSIAGRRA
jgi:integrase